MTSDAIRTEPAAAGPRAGLGRRAIWVVGDQALASLSNAGLTIGLARVVSPVEYGAFALAFTVYTLVDALSEAVTGQVLVVRYTAESQDVRRRAAAAGAGASIAVGAVSAIVVLVAGIALGIPIGVSLVALAIVLPALMVQDYWCTVFVAFGSPEKAFVNDLIWVALWASGFSALIAFRVETAGAYVLMWGLCALVASLIAIRQGGMTPAVGRARAWLVGHRDVSVPSVANSFAILGALQLAFLLVAAVGSVRDVGSLRATQTLLGPLNILGFALSSFAVPEIVRRKLSTRGLILAAAALSGALLIATLAWGGLLLLMPGSVGRELLGSTWAGAQVALPGLVIYSSGIAMTTGATAVMRALNRVRTAFWVSVTLGPLVVICSLVGVRLDGARGASLGFALASLVVVVPCWTLLVRDARLGRRATAILE